MIDRLFRGMQPNILIVDDAAENLDVLAGILGKTGYRIRAVTNGRAALRSMRTYPPDLVLLDITMEEMNGLELCALMKQEGGLKDVPVIFISSLRDTKDKLKAFSIGGVDYITKPFQNEEVLARVGTHLKLRFLQIEAESHNRDLEHMVRLKIQEISESQMATIFALAKLAESRDDETGRHLERVQSLCRSLATRLSEKPKFRRTVDERFVENIYHAGPLHDIGKVGIPDRILLKPGRLTPEEFETMKRHTVIGADTLLLVLKKYAKNDFVRMGIDIARHHHERWDGKGYPDGLSGDRIPLCARILAVIDVYDALRSKRCYKAPVSHGEAVSEIKQGGGTQFDPEIADVFLAMSESFGEEWERISG